MILKQLCDIRGSLTLRLMMESVLLSNKGLKTQTKLDSAEMVTLTKIS